MKNMDSHGSGPISNGLLGIQHQILEQPDHLICIAFQLEVPFHMQLRTYARFAEQVHDLLQYAPK